MRLATRADARLVTRILVDAFHDDPMWGPWAFPDPATRRQHRETIFRLLVEGALRYSHVWLTAGETAAAVWIPPGGTEMSAEQEVVIDGVLRRSLGDRTAAVLHAFEQFETARPDEPHYYLTLLGTDPKHAGQGHAGAARDEPRRSRPRARRRRTSRQGTGWCASMRGTGSA